MSSSTTALRKVPRWLAIILGIASIAIGVLFLRNPGRTLVGLAIVLGIWLLIVGIGQIISIFGDSPGSRMFKLTAGIFGIAAGVIVLSRPMFAGLTTGVLFNWLMGILAIVIGIALFIDGFRGGGALAIILGILAIEFAWGWARERNTYRLNDANKLVALRGYWTMDDLKLEPPAG